MINSTITKSLIFLGCLLHSTIVFSFMYQERTLSIKPFNFVASNIPLGKKVNNDVRLNGIEFDIYRAAHHSYFKTTNPVDEGYTIQFGYLKTTLEYVTQISYFNEKSLGIPRPLVDRSYQFNSRSNVGVSVGINKYIDFQKQWLPYAGFLAGFIFEESVKAFVYALPSQTPVGRVRLQGDIARFNCSFNIGADYLFSDHFGVSITTGINYLSRPSQNYNLFQDRQLVFRENNDEFTIPLIISLKYIC